MTLVHSMPLSRYWESGIFCNWRRWSNSHYIRGERPRDGEHQNVRVCLPLCAVTELCGVVRNTKNRHLQLFMSYFILIIYTSILIYIQLLINMSVDSLPLIQYLNITIDTKH